METYLTPTQVADFLQISVQTARIIIKSSMPYIVIGREIRVKESDLTDYLKNEERRLDADLQS